MDHLFCLVKYTCVRMTATKDMSFWALYGKMKNREIYSLNSLLHDGSLEKLFYLQSRAINPRFLSNSIGVHRFSDKSRRELQQEIMEFRNNDTLFELRLFLTTGLDC